MKMPKSRDIQAKMSSPKVILYTFWLVTVKVLNSYKGKVSGRMPFLFLDENRVFFIRFSDVALRVRLIFLDYTEYSQKIRNL